MKNDYIGDVHTNGLKDRGSGIYIGDEDIKILERYEIDYCLCNSLEELIFKIEEYINDNNIDMPDLEYISSKLSEFQYYHNVRK